eukprot:9802121-Alexandrium_andersonii.AAC.1
MGCFLRVYVRADSESAHESGGRRGSEVAKEVIGARARGAQGRSGRLGRSGHFRQAPGHRPKLPEAQLIEQGKIASG